MNLIVKVQGTNIVWVCNNFGVNMNCVVFCDGEEEIVLGAYEDETRAQEVFNEMLKRLRNGAVLDGCRLYPAFYEMPLE